MVLEAVDGDVVLGTILVLLADEGFVGEVARAFLDELGGLVDNGPDRGQTKGRISERTCRGAWLIKETSSLSEHTLWVRVSFDKGVRTTALATNGVGFSSNLRGLGRVGLLDDLHSLGISIGLEIETANTGVRNAYCFSSPGLSLRRLGLKEQTWCLGLDQKNGGDWRTVLAGVLAFAELRRSSWSLISAMKASPSMDWMSASLESTLIKKLVKKD